MSFFVSRSIDLLDFEAESLSHHIILCVQIHIAHLPKIHQNNRKYNNNNTIPSPHLEGKDDF